ncbi:hypothetical protein EVB99_047 [Rhizobium phage RHph_N3_19]|nr:hypothetical protein EVB99_047 [Rhizobium phage RHph_N3_19]
MYTIRVVILMRISKWFVSILTRVMNAYDNWKHPKKFKSGDRVRYNSEVSFWQDLEVLGYEFYYKGWWIYLKDLNGYSDTVSLKEYELELILQEYKYDQSGDTEDDI